MFVELALIDQDTLHYAPQGVLPASQMLLNGLRYDLKHDGGGIYELEDTDSLDVVLYDQKGDHTWQEQASLELILDLLSEVGVQMSRVKRCL